MKKGHFQNPAQKQRRRKLRNNATETEQILWSCLRKKQLGGYRFTRQYGIGNYIVDFYCPKCRLAVELDGGQHNEEKNKEYDEERTNFIKQQGIKVIRFWNTDVFHRLPTVCDEILKALDQISPL